MTAFCHERILRMTWHFLPSNISTGDAYFPHMKPLLIYGASPPSFVINCSAWSKSKAQRLTQRFGPKGNTKFTLNHHPPPTHFSPRKGCPRVVKFCLGFKLTKKKRFEVKQKLGIVFKFVFLKKRKVLRIA
jgi:hypothetical protein